MLYIKMQELYIITVRKSTKIEIYTVSASGPQKMMKELNLRNSSKTFNWQVDPGATCNVLPFKDYVRVTGDQKGEKLEAKSIRIDTYGGARIRVAGSTDLQLKDLRGKKYSMRIVVVYLDANPLLSLQTSKDLGIISFPGEYVGALGAKGWLKEEIIEEYRDVFDGLGCLEGTYSIVIDDSVQPVIHPPRKVPVSLRDQIKDHLDQLVKDEILAPVTRPTDWVSSMVVVHKPGKLRVCLDPRHLNNAIKREHYPMPTIEDVATRLIKNAKVFTVLDAKNGFWQVALDSKSSFLTTFNTPFGRYRWKRMPFGIRSAPEVWQRKMNELIENLRGVEVIADDFLVCGFGDTEEEAIKDHDSNLAAFLRRARQKNLKLNSTKMKLRLTEVPFIGHVLIA